MYSRDWSRRATCALFSIVCSTAFHSAVASTTTMTVEDAVTLVYPEASTMLFPVVRSGDLGFEVLLDYHTANGTAIGGVDYTATAGTLDAPAGVVNSSIPVAVSAKSHPAQLTFDLVLDRAIGIGAQPAFAAQQTFATGFQPFRVAYADLNGDGKPDVIVENGDSTFSVLLNTTPPGAAAPTFAAQQIVSTTEPISAITVADINGNGKPDVIVANAYGGSVSVFFNRTAPGATTVAFAARQTFSIGNVSATPNHVAVADLNGDGKPDLVVSAANLTAVAVLLNTTTTGSATAAFATKKTFTVGTNPVRVATADINGDGKLDLIVANYQARSISVLLNTTAPGAVSPSFAAQQVLATGGFPEAIGAVDLNGDGRPDLAIANSADNTVSVFLNSTTLGSTTVHFAAQKTFATLAGPVDLQLLDINGDGKADIVVSNLNSDAVSVLVNTTFPGSSAPRFAAQRSFTVGNEPASLAAVDLNGDGKPDLVTASITDQTASVLINTSNAGVAMADFPNEQVFLAEFDSYNVTVADLDGDGKPDVIRTDSNENKLVILQSTTAPGSTVQTFAAPLTLATGNGPSAVVGADLNGDGRLDLVVANFSDSTVSVLRNKTVPGTAASFAARQNFAAGESPDAVAIGDVNGDGKPDLLIVNHGIINAPTVSVLLNTTTPGATTLTFAVQKQFPIGDQPGSIALADLNGDGRLDIIVGNSSSEANASVLLNTTVPGAAVASFAPQQKLATGEFVRAVAATDVNGDGKPDIIVGDNSGTVSVLLNTTAPGASVPSFAVAQNFIVGEATVQVIPVDIDGDGKVDIVSANYANRGVVILRNTTVPGSMTASFDQLGPYLYSTPLDAAAVADLNGDGRPDIVVTASLKRTMSVLLNTQYDLQLDSPAIGTIANDRIFANGFE